MILETENLLLRPWSKSDIDDLMDGLNNYNVSKWLSRVPYPYSRDDAENWLQYCEISEKEGSYEFAVELKSERRVIGGLSLNKIDRLQGTAGGGMWLNENYQGKGFGLEAFNERARFAFIDLDLRRLENGCFSGNAPSQKLLYRLGYSVEGIRRKGIICLADGEYKDEVICALMRDEWAIHEIPAP